MKEPKENYVHMLHARLNKEEYAMFRELQYDYGIKISTILRKCLRKIYADTKAGKAIEY